MLVLAIDTSTPTITAGVVRLRRPHEVIAEVGSDRRAGAVHPIEVLAQRTADDAFGHAERLIPLATDALNAVAHAMADVDAVVVGLGPGPFTGLRVGIATAAALGDALDIPVHGVPSHDAMSRTVADGTAGDAVAEGSGAEVADGPAAHAVADRAVATDPGGGLLVVTDARRREVYVSAYRDGLKRVLGPLVVAPADLPALLAEHRLVVRSVTGAGVGLLAGAIQAYHARPVRPLSLGLIETAALPLMTGHPPGPLSPLYLRRPDATEPGARRSVLGRA